jgi:prepilin-type N-terminal cleavage/methylation domain-containing protein
VSRRKLRATLRPDGRGFTLVEVILAVSILAVVVLLATAALRVGLRAWEAGQRRADLQQETRALVELVSEALAGASEYHGRLGQNPERIVLFQGEPEEVRFVTSAPPLTLDNPVAPFHAVVLGRKGQDALRLIEVVLDSRSRRGEHPVPVGHSSARLPDGPVRVVAGTAARRWVPTAVRLSSRWPASPATPALVVRR